VKLTQAGFKQNIIYIADLLEKYIASKAFISDLEAYTGIIQAI
jgi:hypothetical protein